MEKSEGAAAVTSRSPGHISPHGICLLMLLALALAAPGVPARDVSNLYSAQVEVADRSPGELARGARAALAAVLVKLTGDRRAAAREGIGALLAAPGAEVPGGGCMTSIQDLHRFAEMLRGGGALDGTRILSPAMLDFCVQNHTGTMRNVLFDMWCGVRNWVEYPASIGCGFFVRGEGNTPGPFSVMNSANAFGGFGAGSTGFIVDPGRDLTFCFLSTGLMEDSYSFERIGMFSGLVLAAMTE